jgi:SAM-dependent methyltransferase
MDGIKTTTELVSLKARLRNTWIAGDFGQIAKSFEIGSREFVERLGLKKGDVVLDVACGTGNTAIPAARAGAEVTGIDIAPNLIEQAIARNEAENLTAEFDVGDAEAMPYDDDSFDVVLTMFGAMFTPRPDGAAELKVSPTRRLITMRTGRPRFHRADVQGHGQARRASWRDAVAATWGTDEAVVNALLRALQICKRRGNAFHIPVRARRGGRYFGCITARPKKLLNRLIPTGSTAERPQFLWADYNQATDAHAKVESEYLNVRAFVVVELNRYDLDIEGRRWRLHFY